jgi:hypothetical protein
MMSTSGLQAKIGKEPELEAALQRLRGKNADIPQEAADVKSNLPILCFNGSVFSFHFTRK